MNPLLGIETIPQPDVLQRRTTLEWKSNESPLGD